MFPPRNYEREAAAMKEMLKTEIIQLIDKMNEPQLHILLGFIKRLFGLDD